MRRKKVFINCPFDKEYRLLLNSLLFTILYLGAEPSISETKSSSDIRINKIKELITLQEEFDSDEEIRDFTSQDDAFSFWNNEKENIYQDYILRDKK